MMTDFWYIVQTNPQCEKKAVEEIRRAGFRAYLPKAGRVIRHHRTKLVSIKRSPALTGYVFMRFPEGDPNWYALRQCQGVKGVLYCDGKPYVLARELVAGIMRAQRALDYDVKEAKRYRMDARRGKREPLDKSLLRQRFRVGTHVRSTSGPFQSIIAEVRRVTERGTVQAVANILGKEVPVEYALTEGADTLEIVYEAA
jgi:transcription antitermination factor NusG